VGQSPVWPGLCIVWIPSSQGHELRPPSDPGAISPRRDTMVEWGLRLGIRWR
jgi:hypothetical protein